MIPHAEKVLSSLKQNDVRYLIIGGVAANIHGVNRATFDLDILIDPTKSNAERLLKAFIEANMGCAYMIEAESLLAQEVVIFDDYIRVDVQMRTPGVQFSEAWENKLELTYLGSQLYALSKADLIKSKEAAGRPIDLEDVRKLKMQSDENG